MGVGWAVPTVYLRIMNLFSDICLQAIGQNRKTSIILLLSMLLLSNYKILRSSDDYNDCQRGYKYILKNFLEGVRQLRT